MLKRNNEIQLTQMVEVDKLNFDEYLQFFTDGAVDSNTKRAGIGIYEVWLLHNKTDAPTKYACAKCQRPTVSLAPANKTITVLSSISGKKRIYKVENCSKKTCW